MYTYYEVFANIDDGSEVMFGSYDRTDCTAEIEAERDGWKEEGFRKIRIQSRETEEAPAPEIYGAANCRRWSH